MAPKNFYFTSESVSEGSTGQVEVGFNGLGGGTIDIFGPQGMEQMGIDMEGFLDRVAPPRVIERTMTVARAREAKIIGITTVGDTQAQALCDRFVEVAATHEALSPFVTVVPLQLYAYCVADHKGTDVDQPRNLAKTVTVE